MDQKKSAREIIALAISSVIVITMAVYWIVQINGVRQMFKLAAGE